MNGLIMELKTIIFNLLNLYRKAIKENEYLDELPFVPHREELINIWYKIKSNPNIRLNSVAQLGKTSYMSERTLYRNFKKLFDKELSSFLQDECLNRGFHLIISTNYSIDDIAMELDTVR